MPSAPKPPAGPESADAGLGLPERATAANPNELRLDRKYRVTWDRAGLVPRLNRTDCSSGGMVSGIV